MAKVVQLSTQVANMIAAGEVVESPVSVVKELTENSIDAKATRIEIHLVDAGVTKIEVMDNGCGMSLDDAVMAFSRHATSKIKNEYDLARISTLGFRGEALPSIASVSQVELITKEEASDGCKVTLRAGHFISKETYPTNNGTRIIVSNLFYNTPARLKYLKTPSQILSQISDLVSKLALSNRNIKFLLTNNGQTIIQTLGNGDLPGLFASIYGVNIAKLMNTTEGVSNGFKASIYYSSPTITRSRRNDMTLIVNGRYVRSNLVNNAISDAYKNYIPPMRYPVCVIDLTVDPLLIDVNVHPQKMEIKFSLEDELYRLVKETLVKALGTKTHIPEAKHSDIISSNLNVFDIIENNKQEEIKKEITIELPKIEKKLEPVINERKTLILEEKEEVLPHVDESKVVITPSDKRLPYMEYIGQLHGTYLLFQNEDGLFLVDQHAAQERINYEYYFEKFSNPKADSVQLLLPLTLTFTPSECFILEEAIPELKKFGIELERVSETGFFLRSIPAWVKPDASEDIIERILYHLLCEREFNIGNVRDSLAKMCACKASIKANHAVAPNEVKVLMETLDKCKNPFNCPHGRPVFVKITSYEIEKLFKRIV